MGLSCLISFEGTLHLATRTVVGGQEIGTNEQEDKRGTVQMRVDVLCLIRPRDDLATVPGCDEPLVSERAQMVLQLLKPPLILIGIEIKDLNGSHLRIRH